MEQEVFIVLLKNFEALSFSDIIKETGYSEDQVLAALTALQSKELICKSRHGRYQINYVFYDQGTVIKRTKDKITVFVEDYGTIDIFVGTAKYTIGSTLLLGITEDVKGTVQAKILKKLEKAIQHAVGLVQEKNGNFYVQSHDKYYDLPNIDPKLIGHFVEFKLSSRSNRYLYASVVRTVCAQDDPLVNDKRILAMYGVTKEFPQEVLQEAFKIPTVVRDCDRVGRIDLTKEAFVTIDDVDTKDIDDAINCYYDPNKKQYHLQVAIADVSYYVQEGSALDREALKRATSIYLEDITIPMLPKELSEGICSLNPDVDRLAYIWDMWIDLEGNVHNFTRYRGVIHSQKKMNYDDVDRYLSGELVQGYEMFPQLKTMAELASIIDHKQKENGSIDFKVNEIMFQYNQNGPLNLAVRNRGISSFIIEKFMLVTNEQEALYNKKQGHMSIYRQHEAPKLQKFKYYMSKLEDMNIPIGIDVSAIEKVDHTFLQQVLAVLSDTPYGAFAHSILVRSMNLARYGVEAIDHFGLASPYVQVTSPIRRYNDLIVHRSIEENNHKQVPLFQKEQFTKTAVHITNQTRKANRMERFSNQMKVIDYLANHTDQIYKATIFEITSHEIIVKLHPYLIEASLALPVDRPVYLGDMIEVCYQYGNKDNGKIYCSMVKKEKNRTMQLSL